MTRGRWGAEVKSTWHINSESDCDAAAVDLAGQFESYALEWLSRDWDFGVLLKALQSDETSPFLITSENGSYLRLDAELPCSPVRKAHIKMVKTHLFDSSIAPSG
jgi:hypothetical protein